MKKALATTEPRDPQDVSHRRHQAAPAPPTIADLHVEAAETSVTKKCLATILFFRYIPSHEPKRANALSDPARGAPSRPGPRAKAGR